MLGDVAGMRDIAEVEGRGVVGAHRLLVVGIIIVYQPHSLDGVASLKKLVENGEHAFGNTFVDHHLAHKDATLQVDVKTGEVAELCARHRAVGLETLALHDLEDVVGKGLTSKKLLVALLDDVGFGYLLAWKKYLQVAVVKTACECCDSQDNILYK